jgi:hypothetical protein
MLVSCFCGNLFLAEGDISLCPACRAIATLPRLSTTDEREMTRALRRLLDSRPPDLPL